MQADDFLKKEYKKSMGLIGSDNVIKTELKEDITTVLNVILDKSESSKGVLTVVLTSLVYKILYPHQDIRNHQTSIKDGYSGRTFDTKYITPFLKSVAFPSMSESGWLTRSLEQKTPYDKNYSGAISPKKLKNAFLETIEIIQNGKSLDALLSYLLQGLIIKRNLEQIKLAKPLNLPISSVIELLTKHFFFSYSADGAARLPVLAIYSTYQCFINEIERFKNKELLAIESHTSADTRSGRIGDIQVNSKKDKVFEAVEVKHGIPITAQHVKDAFEKFKTTQVNRYYLLSTANINSNEADLINNEILKIRNVHGCNVIVNGIKTSLNYYLRLILNTSDFIENYVSLVEKDKALKYEHKKRWNEIVST